MRTQTLDPKYDTDSRRNQHINQLCTADSNTTSRQVLHLIFSDSFLNFKDTEFRSLIDFFDVSIPITSNNKLIACVIFGGSKKLTEDPEAIKFIQTISNILFVALQNTRLLLKKIEQEAIKNEIEIARKLQSLLFPQKLPYSEHLKINATYIPHLSVGGDYYDYIPLNDGEFMVCVADVSGKGISAAFIMSNLQAALRVLARQGLRMEDIVHELNALVFNNTKGEKFVTFFIAKYIPRKNMIVYVNCGHNAPLLMSEDKHIESLDKGSLILGIMPNLPSIETGRIYNVNNSLLFAYTDGLVESFEKTDTEAGLDLVRDILVKQTDFNMLHTTILNAMNIHEEAFDDITILSCFFSNETIESE